MDALQAYSTRSGATTQYIRVLMRFADWRECNEGANKQYRSGWDYAAVQEKRCGGDHR